MVLKHVGPLQGEAKVKGSMRDCMYILSLLSVKLGVATTPREGDVVDVRTMAAWTSTIVGDLAPILRTPPHCAWTARSGAS